MPREAGREAVTQPVRAGRRAPARTRSGRGNAWWGWAGSPAAARPRRAATKAATGWSRTATPSPAVTSSTRMPAPAAA